MPAAEEVGSGVIRITAPNPGPKTLEGTNLYFVGWGQKYLIDAGPRDDVFTADLAAYVGDSVSAIVLTHDHPDHAGGVSVLARCLRVPVYVNANSSVLQSDSSADVRPIAAHQRFDVGNGQLEAIPMPGHSHDHVCFFLRPGEVLFAGDNVLGRGTSLIALPEGDMVAYMESLAAIQGLEPNLIAPGHGPMVTNPAQTLQDYVSHRREREEQLLGVLREGDASAEQIVDRVYQLEDPELYGLAVLSVGAQLDKLDRESRVERLPSGRYRVRPSS